MRETFIFNLAFIRAWTKNFMALFFRYKNRVWLAKEAGTKIGFEKWRKYPLLWKYSLQVEFQKSDFANPDI